MRKGAINLRRRRKWSQRNEERGNKLEEEEEMEPV